MRRGILRENSRNLPSIGTEGEIFLLYIATSGNMAEVKIF